MFELLHIGGEHSLHPCVYFSGRLGRTSARQICNDLDKQVVSYQIHFQSDTDRSVVGLHWKLERRYRARLIRTALQVFDR